MKRAQFKIMAFMVIGLIVLIPVLACAAPESTPPVAPPVVREGTFAVSLADALELDPGDDEILAESRLGELGISPRNGWIADYPVTPDILGELQQTLIAAADGSRLQMSREEALKSFYDVNIELGLSVVPYADESTRESNPEDYPAPATVNNYYYNYGPPVVTYYEPPPNYVYLYAWVPFPFWSWGCWFPGFYVLNDFHKTVVIDSRVVFVSNHYRDVRYKRVYVVDPVKRYHHSGTVYGVGAPHYANNVYKGSPGVARQVLDINRNRMMRAHAGRNITAPSSGRSTPVIRPVSPNREKSGPAPITRAVNTPVHIEKNDRNKKESVQPQRIENSRTVQARRPVPVQNDKIDRQVRPMLKSIETKPAQMGKGSGQVDQRISRPPSIHNNNYGQASKPPVIKKVSSPHNSGAPARIQPQQKNEGRGSVRQNQASPASRANQGRQDRGRGSDKKEAPPPMKGSEKGNRG